MSFHSISIVTVCLNAEKYIEQAICSILSQTYDNIEYIIIDGGSVDQTLQIINKYKDSILHVVSEMDSGISDAMNKGLKLATGEYVVFIHADDYLVSNDSIETVLSSFSDNDDVIACAILFGKQLDFVKPYKFNFWLNFKGLHHQGVICRRSLLSDLGGFDTQFKITMDYDFFLRAYRYGAKFRRLPLVLSVMRDTGISSRTDWNSLKERFKEERKVHEKNCNSKLLYGIYALYWQFYVPYKKLKTLVAN